jgi:hypothetical protein
MDLGRKYGQIKLNMKATINKVKNTVLDFLLGEMAPLTKDHSKKIIYMVKDVINGQMDDLIQVIGSKIKCMARVYLLGLMAEFTKANMYMIKNRDMVFSHGQMEELIKDIG